MRHAMLRASIEVCRARTPGEDTKGRLLGKSGGGKCKQREVRNDAADKAVALGNAYPLEQGSFSVLGEESDAAFAQTGIGPGTDQLAVHRGQKPASAHAYADSIVDTGLEGQRKRQFHSLPFPAIEDNKANQSGVGKG